MSKRSPGWIDYTAKDYDALRSALMALANERLGDVWTDQSDNDLGVLMVELFAHMGDLLLYYQDRLAAESYLSTAAEAQSVVNLLRLIGYELRPPQPASADLRLLFAADATATIAITSGLVFTTSAAVTGTPVRFRYVGLPFAVDLATVAVTTHEGVQYKELPRTVPVQQVDRIIDADVAGSSDASPGQRFALASSPLIDGSLSVFVDEGAGPVEWIRVGHLLNSAAIDTHFVVRRDADGTAWIEFGDGNYGRIPVAGRNNITVSYRVGGGAKGNVPKHSITAESSIPELELVIQDNAGSGGSEREDAADASFRAPRLFRSQGRAVTAADYEAHALSFGVAKTRARAPGWNRIDIYIAPAGGGHPSELLKQDLVAYFEDKRMMTAEVVIHGPEYVPLMITGELVIEPYFFANEVQQAVENALARLFSFDAVNFEDTLYLSKVYEAVEDIEGVKAVYISKFAKGNEVLDASETTGRLNFGWNQIPDYQGVTWDSVVGGLGGD
jgi:hypothetical protein